MKLSMIMYVSNVLIMLIVMNNFKYIIVKNPTKPGNTNELSIGK